MSDYNISDILIFIYNYLLEILFWKPGCQQAKSGLLGAARSGELQTLAAQYDEIEAQEAALKAEQEKVPPLIAVAISESLKSILACVCLCEGSSGCLINSDVLKHCQAEKTRAVEVLGAK